MERLFVILIIFGGGFVFGAFFAFLLGQRFLRKESERLYARWLRQEKRRRIAWMSRLSHDLKNPLFLIQAFAWTYLEKRKNKKISLRELDQSSQKMAEVLKRQADKALGVLKEAADSSKVSE